MAEFRNCNFVLEYSPFSYLVVEVIPLLVFNSLFWFFKILTWVSFSFIWCTILLCTALNSKALINTVLLQCSTSAPHLTALLRPALHCTAQPCTALHCTTLHLTALHCLAFDTHNSALRTLYSALYTLHCTVQHITDLQCTDAVQCVTNICIPICICKYQFEY